MSISTPFGWRGLVSLGREHMLSYAILRSTSCVVAFGSPHVAACHLLLLKIEPNKKWKSIRTNGNRSEQMEIGPNKWKSNQTTGNRSEHLEIGQWKSIRNGNWSEQMEIDPNKWKSIRTNGNQSEQMEIEPNE